MVRHEHVGMHRALVPPRCGAKQLQVEMPVAIRVETRITVVPALQDVQRYAGQV